MTTTGQRQWRKREGAYTDRDLQVVAKMKKTKKILRVIESEKNGMDGTA